MEYTVDYITRGGMELEITLPLDSFGRFLSERHLTDSEKRKLRALRMKQELEPEAFFPVHTIH